MYNDINLSAPYNQIIENAQEIQKLRGENQKLNNLIEEVAELNAANTGIQVEIENLRSQIQRIENGLAEKVDIDEFNELKNSFESLNQMIEQEDPNIQGILQKLSELETKIPTDVLSSDDFNQFKSNIEEFMKTQEDKNESVQNTLTKLDEKINSIQKDLLGKLSEQSDSFNKLDQEFKKLERKLVGLSESSANVEEFLESIADLQNKITVIEDSLRGLKGELGNKLDIKQLTDELRPLNNKMEELESMVNDFQRKLNSLKGEVNSDVTIKLAEGREGMDQEIAKIMAMNEDIKNLKEQLKLIMTAYEQYEKNKADADRLSGAADGPNLRDELAAGNKKYLKYKIKYLKLKAQMGY